MTWLPECSPVILLLYLYVGDGIHATYLGLHAYDKHFYLLSHLQNTRVHLLFLNLFFQDRVSLYSPDCPGTHSVDQAGLELRNLPASASQVLGLKACANTARRP